ncbi:MAG: hypothetical protein VB141_11660 [Burkholderia gladioli]
MTEINERSLQCLDEGSIHEFILEIVRHQTTTSTINIKLLIEEAIDAFFCIDRAMATSLRLRKAQATHDAKS